jgi:hypothetical protein
MTSTGAGGMAPAACEVAGEAPGDTVVVVSPEVHAVSFAVAPDCSALYPATYLPDATDAITRCDYTGCDVATLSAQPRLGGLYIDAEPIALDDSIVYGNQLIGGSEIDGVGLDLSSHKKGWGNAPPMHSVAALWAWGDAIVAESEAMHSGGKRDASLDLYGGGHTQLFANHFHIQFTARDASEGYALGREFGMQFEPIITVAHLKRSGNKVTSTQGTLPATSLDVEIVALPEALLVVRSPEGGVSLSTCDHAAATPCAVETPLPAAMSAHLAGPFLVAHGRLYAQRLTAGLGETVYCATSDVAAGTCSWKAIGPSFGGATVTLLTSDPLHVYRGKSTPSEDLTVERIAR